MRVYRERRGGTREAGTCSLGIDWRTYKSLMMIRMGA